MIAALAVLNVHVKQGGAYFTSIRNLVWPLLAVIAVLASHGRLLSTCNWDLRCLLPLLSLLSSTHSTWPDPTAARAQDSVAWSAHVESASVATAALAPPSPSAAPGAPRTVAPGTRVPPAIVAAHGA